MKAYILYTHDDRGPTPAMEVVTAADAEEARRWARHRLAASPHHRAVEIWLDEALIDRIEAPAA
ncbi:MAG TPA: hypothetical protein VIC25_03060 [Caulobacteraceae bacterium]